MLTLAIILLAILALEPLICGFLHKKSFLWHDYAPQYVVSTILTVVCCFVVVIGVVVYWNSIDNIAEMEAFYDNTAEVYQYTVDKSEHICIYAVRDVEAEMNQLFNAGQLAYFELAKSVNENLKEFRERIKDYNNGLYIYRKYNGMWLTDSFVIEVPERLKPIRLRLK